MSYDGAEIWKAPEFKQRFACLARELARELALQSLLTERNYDSGTIAANARIVDEKLDELAMYALEHACVPDLPNGRKSRAERLENTAKIMTLLRDYAFSMLGCENEETLRLARKKIDSGSYIAGRTGIRGPSVGKILNLKGKNPDCDPQAQLLFEVCRDPDFFRIFADFVKSRPVPSNTMPPATLALHLASRLTPAR